MNSIFEGNGAGLQKALEHLLVERRELLPGSRIQQNHAVGLVLARQRANAQLTPQPCGDGCCQGLVRASPLRPPEDLPALAPREQTLHVRWSTVVPVAKRPSGGAIRTNAHGLNAGAFRLNTAYQHLPERHPLRQKVRNVSRREGAERCHNAHDEEGRGRVGARNSTLTCVMPVRTIPSWRAAA
jgi:hypothetical protein